MDNHAKQLARVELIKTLKKISVLVVIQIALVVNLQAQHVQAAMDLMYYTIVHVILPVLLVHINYWLNHCVNNVIVHVSNVTVKGL